MVKWLNRGGFAGQTDPEVFLVGIVFAILVIKHKNFSILLRAMESHDGPVQKSLR
jgi:hypothetical protein